jgi:signal transduction histidine kinase/CheY-like chemotaxis protein
MLSYLSKSTLQNVNLKNNLVVNKEDWNSLVFLLKKNEKLENYPIELLEKEGKIVSKKTDIRNVKNNDGKTLYFEGIIVGNQNNNSNNNELLKELEELKEKEKIASSQVNKANYTKNVKSQYLANMTHEIKTPINSIVGFLTLIEQKLFDSEEELMDFAHNARISADSLLEIINNILDISKIEAGKMELDDIEFDLSQEVTKAKSIALPAGGNDKVKISTEISNKINAKLIGDPLRYRQILINVLSNSVKYTETGSIDILVEIDKVRESNCSIKTIVRDTGSGIPKEQLSILFKPYTQVKTKKWNKKDGSGLGLMICKELVKLLDGEIIIKSKEGKGTIVEFTTLFKTTKDFMLPEKGKEEAKVTTTEEVKAEANVAEKKIEIEEQIEENATDKKTDELKPDNNEPKTSAKEEVNSSDFVEAEHTDVKRILLVEDNPISQKVELRLLKESGYNVEAVSNGFDAIEAVKTNSFNLVLMDVEMAEMDGIESTKRIRALEPPTGKVPIIAVTAHSSMKDREKCLASGMDDYIAKPININFMKMTIDHWLLKEVETSL